MASTSIRNIDVSQLLRRAGAQFSGLDRRDPSSWPAVPRYALYLLIAAVVVGLLWFLWLTDVEQELETERNRESGLRTDYQAKLQKAVSLEELKKQRVQVMQYVTLLEKQLPSKAEMDALLSDINQAGLGRSSAIRSVPPGTTGREGLLRRTAHRGQGDRSAITTSVRSRPTSPTCRAS
ncbi:hypothetical protein MASR1M50_23750 [Burkholderiales bacterium]